MITIDTKAKFLKHVIAQDDDGDYYSESGFVAVAIPKQDFAAITRYGHCSCYDTWICIAGYDYESDDTPCSTTWDWQGTIKDLVAMAKHNADPCLPERTIADDDCDADHLRNVYAQVLAWDEARRKQTRRKQK